MCFDIFGSFLIKHDTRLGVLFILLIVTSLLYDYSEYYVFSRGFLEGCYRKHGLSYAIYKILLSSPKMWSILCNFWKFFPFSKKNGLSYVIYSIFSTSLKTWTIMCIFWNFFLFS